MSSVLDAIGNTTLVRLSRVVPADCAEIHVKLESENPTGSMKDRMAIAAIGKAEADGRLREGYRVVEYTGGSTGASLALVCAVKGYALKLVTSDAFSLEKRDHMIALGAELELVPSERGLATRQLFLDMIARAKELAEQPRSFWFDQLSNVDTIAGYHPLGEEIWRQTSGRVDAFVHGVGTSASIRGAGTALKSHNPAVQIIAVEPAESAVLSGGQAGGHRIEGIGIGRTPPLWDAALVDGTMSVSTEEALAMARRIAREEGLFAGVSSGGNVVAAIRVGQRLGRGATVVSLLVDSGLKYLSTELYRTA